MKVFKNPITGEPVEMSDAEYKRHHDATLALWEKAKATLDKAKEAEMALRKEYVALASDPTKEKGTENILLENGYKAKVVKKINYGFIKDADGNTDWEAVMNAQDAIEKLGNEGAFIAERLFKWSADLSVSEYNKLDPKYKAIADKVIVTSEGSPTLEIVAPKNK